MCYAKPGPRCYGHASEKVKNTKEKLDKAQATVSELEEEASRLAQKHPNTYTNRHDYKGIKERHGKHSVKVGMLKRELRDDNFDADATTGGIEALEQRIAVLNPALENEEQEYKSLSLRLNVAKQNYKGKLIKYDYEKGTVNGRNPSPYGSDEGIMILQKRKKGLEKFPVKEAGDKKDKYEAKLSSLENQIAHAKATKSHAQANITDYASASLEGNKARLQKESWDRVSAQEKYDEGVAAFTAGSVDKMKDFLKKQQAAGLPKRSQWSAKDKREYAAMEAHGEALWAEKVKPYEHRIRQLSHVIADLEKKIEKGSITPRQRAALTEGRTKYRFQK